MKVLWSDEAIYTFEQNIIYLRNKWNEGVIENFINKVDEAIILIVQNPFLFPTLNKKKLIHRCLIVKQVTLYYKIESNQILLLTFWNNYQDPKRLKL